MIGISEGAEAFGRIGEPRISGAGIALNAGEHAETVEGRRLVLGQAVTTRLCEEFISKALRSRVLAKEPGDRSCMIEQGAEAGRIGGLSRRRQDRPQPLVAFTKTARQQPES